ncbi:MAG: hypothetical protein ABI678_29145, partial [Kofleriaceae bacterium]
QPRYRHHFLLLEPQGTKLAKLHGSIPWSELGDRYEPDELLALLGRAANLDGDTPAEMLATFSWERVPREDKIARWDGRTLEIS